jgi:hypothetical protein
VPDPSGNKPDIVGVKVTIEGNGSAATAADRRINVDITKDGSAGVGSSKTLDLPLTTDSVQTLGSENDLWGSTYTPSEINLTTFGLRIQKNTATADTINIDHVTMEVTFYDLYRATVNDDGTGGEITHELTVGYADEDEYAGKHKKISITPGATDGFLVKLQFRADGRKKDDPFSSDRTSPTSITNNGERSREIKCKFIDRPLVADTMAGSILDRRENALTQLQLTFTPGDRATLHHLVQRKISDRIRVAYNDMGLDDEFFIEGESARVTDGGTRIVWVWQLREA